MKYNRNRELVDYTDELTDKEIYRQIYWEYINEDDEEYINYHYWIQVDEIWVLYK